MRGRAARCTLAAVIALSASVARADAAAGDSACVIRETGRDSVQVVVVGTAFEDTLGTGHHRLRIPPSLLPYIVEAVRMHFEAPPTLPLPVMDQVAPVPTGDAALFPNAVLTLPRRVTRLLGVDAYFTLSASGPPHDVAVTHTTMSEPLERSVRNAILAIRPDDFGMLPQGAEGARVELMLSAAPSPTAMQQPFFGTWLKLYTEQSGADVSAHDIKPEFPSAAARVHIADTVDAKFVVDEKGHVPLETITIIRARYGDFIESVAQAIARSRYKPAIVEGCPAASFVYRRFVFTLDR